MVRDCTGSIVCPLCGGRLRLEGNSLVCPESHTFDVARSGYVNLLPSTRKLPETVGDSAEMLAARRRFLESGHYDPLVEVLRAQAPEPAAPGYVVEVGSGTGHYLAALEDSAHDERCYFGVDISKAAARVGAGRHKGITFLVADVHKGIPLASDGAALLLDIFSPRDPQEFARVLHPEGRVCVVIPGPRHLGELIARFDLLAVQEDKESRLTQDFEGSLRLVERIPVTYEMDLPPDAIGDVVAMGPSARHVTAATDRAIENADPMSCSASFVVLTFECW